MKQEQIEKLKSRQFGVFLDDFLYCSIPDKRPIIDHFLYAQDVLMFQGEPGEGKSTFMNQLMYNATTGTSFLGFLKINRPLSVLLIQVEGNRTEQNERMKALEVAVNFNSSNFVHINTANLCFDVEEDCKMLYEQINMPIQSGHRSGFDLVIIDPLYATIFGDPSKAEVAAQWQRGFRKYMQGHPALDKAGFVIVSHPKKSSIDGQGKTHHASASDAFGARNWSNFFSSIYAMRNPKKGNASGTKRKIEAGKRRDKDKLTNTFECDFNMDNDTYFINIDGRPGEVFEYMQGIGKWIGRQKLIKYFRGEYSISENALMCHINKLLDDKLIEKTKVNGKIGYRVMLQEGATNV